MPARDESETHALTDRRTFLKACTVTAVAARFPAFAACTGSSPGAFSEGELARIDEAMRAHVGPGKVPGIVTLVAHRGEVRVGTHGVMDLEGGAPMRRDTIFRIASMTKPVTAAAAMVLVEEGELGLEDPVDPWLPELSDPRVLTSLGGPLDDTVPAERPITLRHLLALEPGIGAIMVFPPRHPIQFAMSEAGVAPGPSIFSGTPEEFMASIGSLPLVHQPGEGWLYHTGLDIAGVLVARAAGTSLDDFMAERIFEPLGMTDTGFFVPADKLDRLATAYHRNEEGELVVWDEARGGEFASAPAFQSGGAGLASTADDYLAFARMMLNEDDFEGERILSTESVKEMTRDQVGPAVKSEYPFYPGFWDDRGWGLGLSVVTGADEMAPWPGRYGWDGGYGTYFIADPKADLVAIVLTQRMMNSADDTRIMREFLKLAYEAIEPV